VEDLVADKFGVDAVSRMSLNFGVSLQGPGIVKAAFFNRPNHLGAKITAYARQKGITTPFYVTMTNIVKAIEDNYSQP
jgi:hypothetical protein